MNSRILRIALIAWALWAGALASLAQKRNANVLFGRNWLFFSDPQQLPLVDSISVGGCASLSDTSGQLKAYLARDPIAFLWRIYNGEHDPLPGTPAELELGQANWSRALFIPKPGSLDSAYLAYIDNYTNSPTHMFRLGVVAVDVGAPGELASGVQPTINFISTDVAACFMAVPHANSQDYWIVVQPSGTNAFHAHQVSAGGIDPVPVVSASGPVRSIDWQNGQWMPNTAGDRFVLSQRKSVSINAIADTLATELFAFDNSSGVASHLITLPSKRAQGAEFSATGRYLYVMENRRLYPDPGVEVTLVQYDLESGDVPASRSVVHSYVSNLVYGSIRIQMLRGIDGRIYCTHEDYPPVLGVIMEPEQPVPLCNYVHEGFACITDQAVGFYPPMKRYHDSPAIIEATPDRSPGESILVAPQPFSGMGLLTHPSLRGPLRLDWLDAMGRLARTETVQGDGCRAAIDASELAPGSYILRVSSSLLKGPLMKQVLVVH